VGARLTSRIEGVGTNDVGGGLFTHRTKTRVKKNEGAFTVAEAAISDKLSGEQNGASIPRSKKTSLTVHNG